MIGILSTTYPLASIRIDGGTQPRTTLDWTVITDYAQAMLEGFAFPPVIVFYDGSEYWLADGFHRYHAVQQICRDTIDAEIKQGTRRDAVLYSVGANSQHGLRRTNADKRKAVETLLNDPEWARWSDRDIARRCGVDNAFVSKLRKDVSVDGQQIERLVERNGNTYTMNTANIGTTEREASLAGYRGYDKWQEAQKWEEKQPVSSSLGFYKQLETSVKPPALVALQSSESNEWYTPPEYANAARRLMMWIDVDPASCEEANKIVGAKKIHTINDSGLNHSWTGKVWLNPPYGFTNGRSNQEIWTQYLIQQYDDGNGTTTEAVLLVNSATEAKWFQPLYDYLICFTDHRIRFYNTQGESSQPTQGNALVYFGKQRKRFIELFSRFGRIEKEAKAEDEQR